MDSLDSQYILTIFKAQYPIKKTPVYTTLTYGIYADYSMDLQQLKLQLHWDVPLNYSVG